MRKVFALVAFLCALPACTNAQAGFPERSLWLSHTAPSAGQEIRISTVLYNGTDAVVDGTLTFYVDGAKFTSLEVSLPAQSSSIMSAPWVARSGSHSFFARFGTQETTVISITVPEPPPPTALQENLNKATAVATQFASSSAPVVQSLAQAVFEQTESWRNAGAESLERYIESSRTPRIAGISGSAPITGFEAAASPASNGMLHSIAQTAAAAAHFLFRSIYLFYIFFAVILVSLLTWAYRRLRRPGR